MIPVISQFAIGKQLAGPDDIIQLRDRLLRVVAATAIQVTIENAPSFMSFNLFNERVAYGYPSTRSRIKAYANGLKPDETHRSRDCPT